MGGRGTSATRNSDSGLRQMLELKNGARVQIQQFSAITGKSTGEYKEFTLSRGRWSARDGESFSNDLSAMRSLNSSKGIVPEVRIISDGSETRKRTERATSSSSSTRQQTQRLPRFLNNASNGTTVTVSGSGSAASTYVDLGRSDVTKAHIAALEKAGFRRRKAGANDRWVR